MEPRIQYAQTADGVSIAFWMLGEGMTFVYMPTAPWRHIELEWQDPEQRRWYERLAQKRKLVRYDGRGAGLSDRDATDYSLDALVRDLGHGDGAAAGAIDGRDSPDSERPPSSRGLAFREGGPDASFNQDPVLERGELNPGKGEYSR
jgi:hypothetical protein